MRQPIYKGDFLSAFGYALGNSIGAYLGIRFELSAGWNLASILFFCFGLGLTCDWLVPKIEQKHGTITWKNLFVAGIIFVVFEIIAFYYFRYDMNDDLFENIIWVFGYGFSVFLLKKLVLLYKIYKAKKKYGDGAQGYGNFSKKIDCNPKADYKFNQEIMRDYDKELAATCTNGIFLGKKNNGVVAYKGIPYAKPPVGNLRWRKPEEPDASHKIFEAYNFSAVLPQPNAFISELSEYPQSEDCLTVNIWCAAKRGKNLPVVVYFHGGDYSFGGSANAIYDGENFVKEYPDLIFVSCNYRFGIFGIMDFSKVLGGEDYPDSKNLLFYDQIAVLTWLRKNIAAFGGDPDNITIMGDTSGGTSALFLPLFPEGKGLFKRIISISAFPSVNAEAELAQKLTGRIQEYFHINSMEEFRQLSEQQLIEAESKFFHDLNTPILEGLISGNIYEAYSGGIGDGVELILGSNANEFNTYTALIGKEKSSYLFKVVTEYITTHIHQKDIALFRHFMNLVDNDLGQFINYLGIHVPLLRIAKNHAGSGNIVRYFYWDEGSPIKEFGAFSAIEVPYILNNLDKAEKYTIVGGDYTGKLLQNMLVQFIRGEAPSLKAGTVQHNDPIDWPIFQENRAPILCFKDGAVLDKGDIKERADIIEKLMINNPHLRKEYFHYIDDKYSNLIDN